MLDVSLFYIEDLYKSNLVVDISITDRVLLTSYIDNNGQLTVVDHADYELSDVFSGDGKQKSIFFTSQGFITEIIDLNRLKVREGRSVLELLSVKSPMLNVKFNSLGDKYVVISTVPFVEGTEFAYTDIDNNVTYSQVFGKEFTITPSKAADFRNKMLFHLSPNDNLAMLEAQLDILTAVFLKLLNKLPNEKNALVAQFPELLSAVEKTDRYSVLTVKPVDKCMEELEGKKRIRELQQKYYQLK